MKQFILNIIFVLLVPIWGYSQTLTTPNSQNIPVGVNGLPISGFSLDGYNQSTTYKVSLSISGNANATFSVNTTTGLTRDYGFNSWTNITAVNFVGTPQNIENGLNSIKLNTTSTLDGLINLSVVITSQENGMYYNPTNGHMYKSVAASIDYVTAKSLASQSTFDGVQGYLVTITSQDEQNFIVQKTSQNNIWFALEDIAQEGYWRISAGPEAGTLIKTANGQFNGNISGQYNNWCGGEPNNSGNEDAAVTKWGGGGCWNDLPASGYRGGGYVIEYGDWTDPTQSNFNSTQQTQITFTQKDMLWVDYTFDFGTNVDPTDFSGMMYYQESAQSWATNNTTNLTLNSLGKVNVTNQIQETSDGKKATTVGGNVEWCVIYNYDSTNKRYRVGIDIREFPPNGFMFTWVKKLQLFDLWNGDVTFKSNDAYWAEYWIYTDTEFDFTNSNYSSYIRSMSYGNHALRAEFSFEDNVGYKPYSFIFNSPTQTEIETLIDDVVTISDVVLAFNELAGGGINGGLKGDLNGIQLGNADVNGDNNFDFQDTYKLLQHLTGTQSLVESTNTLVYFMKIKTKSDYENTTVFNWKSKYNGTTLMAGVDLTNGLVNFPQYNVTWLGDINLSHSPASAGAVTQSTTKSQMVTLSQSKTDLLELNLDVELVDGNIIVTISVPQNTKNITGSELRIGYDNSKLTYDKMETNSTLSNFDAKRDTYIRIGSISTDGSKNLNGGIEYKVYFKTNQDLKSILGLVGLVKTELVIKDGTQVEVIVR
jgi:hypothetical protein